METFRTCIALAGALGKAVREFAETVKGCLCTQKRTEFHCPICEKGQREVFQPKLVIIIIMFSGMSQKPNMFLEHPVSYIQINLVYLEKNERFKREANSMRVVEWSLLLAVQKKFRWTANTQDLNNALTISTVLFYSVK